MLPPQIVDALIAAGGCTHTPEPQKGCDTCGRPPAPWAKTAQVAAIDWSAEAVDGTVFDKKDLLSVSNIPPNTAARLHVITDNPRIPKVSIGCDPRKGERLHMFTRHSQHMQVSGQGGAQKLSVLVLEVTKPNAQPGDFVRLYLHPKIGPILSTEDLYF